MILVDTSIWIDHLRGHQPAGLVDLLDDGLVLMHPLIAGEIAIGSLRNRRAVLDQITLLPVAMRARDYLVLQLIEGHRLFGRGLSYVDAHLLTSARLMDETFVWTRDKALAAAATQLGVAFDPT